MLGHAPHDDIGNLVLTVNIFSRDSYVHFACNVVTIDMQV